MARLAFPAFLFLYGAVTYGKCVTVWYSATGKVEDEEGRSVADQTVVVQWDEDSGSRQIKTKTGPEGVYSVRIPFNPYSGADFTGADQCSATLHLVRVGILVGSGLEGKSIEIGGQQIHADLVMHTRTEKSKR